MTTIAPLMPCGTCDGCLQNANRATAVAMIDGFFSPRIAELEAQEARQPDGARYYWQVQIEQLTTWKGRAMEAAVRHFPDAACSNRSN